MLYPAPRIAAESIADGMLACGEHRLPLGCFPILVDGVVGRWPAAERWTQGELSRRFGDAEVTCYVAPRAAGTFLQQASERRRLRLAEFLERVFAGGDGDRLHYLRIGADHPLFEPLSEDFEIPRLFERYNPSATGIWIGQAGNVTPFHHDWWHSLLAQVRGRKRYFVIHPLETRALQRSWPAAARFDLEAAPVFAPGGEAFEAISIGFSGILEPGQMLYIPPFWFHQIDTLDGGNISMPIRFDTGQSVDVPLFQLSQDSALRPLTNQPERDPGRAAEVLSDNRDRFHRRERAFVDELVRVRELEAAADELLADVEESATH